MPFKYPTINYRGKINEVPLGQGKLKCGGQNAYAFHAFEGTFPNRPRLALDLWDYDPGDLWPEALMEIYKDVARDPGAWAARCVELGADLVCLHLASSDPAGPDTGPDQAVASVAKVVEAVEVPVIVYGVDYTNKDVETLNAVAEAFPGKNLILGPVTDKNYRRIGAHILAAGHTLIALSATDFNLAEQLNILLFSLGLPKDRLIMDPTTAALGYGLEYCYSVVERLQIGALAVDDQDIQQPMINFVGEEVWRTKEARLPVADNPQFAGAVHHGVMLEAMTAVNYLVAGADLVVLRHPQALELTRDFAGRLYGD